MHKILDIAVSDRIDPGRPELRWAMYAQFAVPGWAVRQAPLSFYKARKRGGEKGISDRLPGARNAAPARLRWGRLVRTRAFRPSPARPVRPPPPPQTSLLLLDGAGDDLYDPSTTHPTLTLRTHELGRTWGSFEWAHAYERAWCAAAEIAPPLSQTTARRSRWCGGRQRR